MAPLNPAYERVRSQLALDSRVWLVTGVAGFIGSNLLETLLRLDQQVIGLDNFATGFRRNLVDVQSLVGEGRWSRFRFIEGDIRDPEVCRAACSGVDYVAHHAALGSVPRSVADPLTTDAVNVTGFLNMLVAARDAKASRFVYAASSSTYGDHNELPKVEERIGRPLSPYAVTKYVNELYADVFSRTYGVDTIGLRYFNVFGPRQDPDGAYAAVIPRWTCSLIHGEPVHINGDGDTSRDFCFVSNAVQANLLAATSARAETSNTVYNIAVGERTSLNRLYDHLSAGLAGRCPWVREMKPVYADYRAGDVRHSLADIGKASRLLDYRPTHTLEQGLAEAIPWYLERYLCPQ